MARFGHLILNEGIWNGDTLLRDVAFYNEMINSSQNLNPAYGLLWWLNGKDGYILPGTAIQFNGSLVPEAPADMFAAMGKDDQRIYVIPSLKMVIVRQGEASGLSLYAKSGFDDELWQYINELNCTVSIDHPNAPSFKLYPNPSREILSVEMKGFTRLSMYDCRGRQVLQSGSQEVSIAHLPDGVYWVRLESMDGLAFEKIVVLH
jgi:hypothetical protein